MNRFLRRDPGITEILARLGKYNIAAETLARLGEYLRRAPAPALDDLHPVPLGRALALDEQPTLELLVAAVHEEIGRAHV